MLRLLDLPSKKKVNEDCWSSENEVNIKELFETFDRLNMRCLVFSVEEKIKRMRIAEALRRRL